MAYEYKVTVGGVEYGMNDILADSVSLTQQLFDSPSIGGAWSAEFFMSFWPKEKPPRMAEVRPYLRQTPDEPWHQLGIFWIDTREQDDELLTIHAYDVILKAGKVWVPDQSLRFPMTMEQASKTIAALMGTTVDKRCVFDPTYTIDHPANDYTLMDVLCYIAAAHGGNWIATAAGELLLVPLFGSAPAETFYLIEEKKGDAITFGGTRILLKKGGN